MSQRETIIRHKAIIQKLRSKPSTFEEIIEKLDSETAISKRTFQRDIQEIDEIYGIEIKFNRSLQVYQIINEIKDDYTNRMFEALDIFQALNFNSSNSEFIQFDTRKPKGTENLNGLLHAIQNKYQVQITYQKFWEDTSERRTIEPYLLKEFKGRWYVVAYDLSRKEFRIFGLDRIDLLRILDVKFQYPQKMDIKKYFEDCFGIISSNNQKPEIVKLLFIKNQGKYIKTMPLHHSQQILEDKNGQMIVHLNLIPSYDFVMEILSYGEFVKIIEPQFLANEVRNRLLNSLEVYK